MTIGKANLTQLINRFAKGCYGLEYSYFEQGAEKDMAKLMHVLGDFKGKEKNAFDGGICFGLAVMYLACNTPAGRRQWPNQAAIMDEFQRGIDGAGRSPSMLHAIAEAFVRQKKASVISKNYRQTLDEVDDDKVYAPRKAAYEKTLLDYQANRGSGNEKTAIRDQLLANFSLQPSPAGRHARNFPISVAPAADSAYDYKNHLNLAELGEMISFVGQRNTFSLISYEQVLKGGHQMAVLGASHGLYFFDPNFGVVYLSFASGMTTFLSRFLPFLYMYKRTQQKNSSYFLAAKAIPFRDWDSLSLTFNVYRYAPL